MARWLPGEAADPDLDDALAPPRAATALDWIRIAAVSARRRKLVVALTFVGCLGAFVAIFVGKKPTYRVETRILTLDRVALPTAARSVYEEVPGRSAFDLVHRRDNLVALLRFAGVVRDADAAQPAANAEEANERLNQLVTKLDKQLEVSAEAGTITIAVDWSDPQQAYDMTKAALQNFLEARHIQEVSSIDEVISVLQGHAAKLRQELDAALEEAGRKAASQPRPYVPRVRQPTAELARLESLAQSKQRALQDLEEIRRRRVADLQAQLEQARNTLSEAHPTVIGLRKDIEAASRESPQVAAMRQEEQDLRAKYTERLAREGFGPNATPASTPLPVVATATREEDPRVRQAQAQYDQMAARLNGARVELDAARAAFKYRYNVIWPPQMPEAPVSPNGRKIFAIGLLVSILAAFAAAVAPDALAGRIVHRVQVERVLGLPVLGEIERR